MKPVWGGTLKFALGPLIFTTCQGRCPGGIEPQGLELGETTGMEEHHQGRDGV